MKHHSPNFLNKLEESEKAENSYISTGLTILGLLLIAALAFTSCSKQAPVKLILPDRGNVVIQTITVDVRSYQFNGVWVLEITYPKILPVETSLTISHGETSVFTTPVGFRTSARTVKSKPTDIRLIEAKGEKNTLYKLNVLK